ncbi:putative transcription initiation factor IIB [Gregarina niphandrodes]|uniref:General transcription factor TFIIB n=1 Tax=Gregarina niphandrodes TaxID=110365 RepID=A0A023B889_GRENI|nr:putative transcription initiation factor IIB [Gregarina niphandrodes]EZG68303.1 putative transcription initiation factor IIB [Gregarina niphandrodes]|eukprot:XP_011134589.1 putative transcription initiation factor IIB [Gregarina niphandrodes]
MSTGTVSTGAAGTIARLNVFASTKRAKQCPTCKDRSVIVYDTHSGDEICSLCGQIIESRTMSEEQEWRSFSNDGGGGVEKSRVGGPNDTWLEDSVSGTTMMGGDKKFGRLAHAHDLATGTNSGDRQLKSAFSNLRFIGDHFGFRNNLLERCREIIKDLQTTGNLKSRTGVTNMLAVVYLAARDDADPLSLKQLTSFDRAITEKDIGKAVNKIKKLLPQNRTAGATTFASKELALRFAASLMLADCVRDLAAHMCVQSEMTKVIPVSSRPHILAGAAIFLACQLYVTQIAATDLAVTAQCGLQSLVEYYGHLLNAVKTILPKGFVPRNVGGINALVRPEHVLKRASAKPAAG